MVRIFAYLALGLPAIIQALTVPASQPTGASITTINDRGENTTKPLLEYALQPPRAQPKGAYDVDNSTLVQNPLVGCKPRALTPGYQDAFEELSDGIDRGLINQAHMTIWTWNDDSMMYWCNSNDHSVISSSGQLYRVNELIDLACGPGVAGWLWMEYLYVGFGRDRLEEQTCGSFERLKA